ncbi:Os08g0421201 [Oryza sativa Japonica Group]|uniref:Os08g0421201 protein n=1 Tax=Oryza sativa subsp. japonica TaxID=39947 RepID=A0A0P0XFR6_ORYSJ|nr:Os08g0421201 [Oryza sativa Japonica Group]
MRSESAARMWPRHTASSRAHLLLAAAAAASASPSSSLTPAAAAAGVGGGGSSESTWATPAVWRTRSIDSFHRRYSSAPFSGLTVTAAAIASIKSAPDETTRANQASRQRERTVELETEAFLVPLEHFHEQVVIIRAVLRCGSTAMLIGNLCVRTS